MQLYITVNNTTIYEIYTKYIMHNINIYYPICNIHPRDESNGKTYYVPNTILKTLYTLTHLILEKIQEIEIRGEIRT